MEAVNHSGLVKIYEILEDKRAFYFCMEHLEGGGLFDKFMEQSQRNVSFGEDHVQMIAYNLILALKHLHENKIIHRDL